MKKKRFVILLIMFSIFIGWLLYSNIRTDKAEMFKVDDTIYLITNEPTIKEKEDTQIGSIQKKIPLYQIPSENNTSNSLKKHTKLYSSPKRTSFPRKIIFERDGQFFFATEKDMSKEQ